MSKVDGDQIEQVDDKKQLSNPKSTSHPEHDEAEDEEIVLTAVLVCGSTRQLIEIYQDEMTANISRAFEIHFIRGIEVPDVATLKKQKDDPVNARDNGIEGERRPHVIILAPYCVAMVGIFAAFWSMKSVVNPDDHDEEIGDDIQDPVGNKVPLAKRLSFGEWVIWW